MIKLFAMYKEPEDRAAFLAHYEGVHMPIVAQTPGLVKTVVNKVTSAPMGGEPPYFLITEMHYPDQETFQRAMMSQENRAAGKDLKSFAAGLVTLLVVEEY
jgi:uncharacterized protein (TIGR02118 family)